MDWQKRMNDAIAYLEAHLGDEVDYADLAKQALCAPGEFGRMFALFASVSVSEYVRLRRLTQAAQDLAKGEKVIDVGIKYGYDSPSAFSRAFKRFHGTAPSLAAKGAKTRYYPRLSFEITPVRDTVQADPARRVNIIGAGERSYAVSISADPAAICSANGAFWDDTGNSILGPLSLPKWGPFVSEEKLQLFGDVSGKRLLEIGCGNGESLCYHHAHGAEELWGLDLSQNQINHAQKLLKARGISAQLVCAPMESTCGIPENYFDFVYAVYAIGWATDLDAVFARIFAYLKPGGQFLFSWSHPIHKCVARQGDTLVFRKNYFDESWYSVFLEGSTLCLADRKLSTYLNALVRAGLVFEALFEQSDPEMILKKRDAFAQKARMLPATFIVRARKPE